MVLLRMDVVSLVKMIKRYMFLMMGTERVTNRSRRNAMNIKTGVMKASIQDDRGHCELYSLEEQ